MLTSIEAHRRHTGEHRPDRRRRSAGARRDESRQTSIRRRSRARQVGKHGRHPARHESGTDAADESGHSEIGDDDIRLAVGTDGSADTAGNGVVARSSRGGDVRQHGAIAITRRRRSSGELFRQTRSDDGVGRSERERKHTHAGIEYIDRRRHQRSDEAMESRSAKRSATDRRDRRHAEHRAAHHPHRQRFPRTHAGKRIRSRAAQALRSTSFDRLRNAGQRRCDAADESRI